MLDTSAIAGGPQHYPGRYAAPGTVRPIASVAVANPAMVT
jgi:hypothetical protein